MVAVGLVGRLGAEARHGLVVNRSQVDVDASGRGIAAHVERILPEGVALVRLAAKLLDAVLAEGQSPQLVIGRGHRSVLALPEPDAGALHYV